MTAADTSTALAVERVSAVAAKAHRALADAIRRYVATPNELTWFVLCARVGTSRDAALDMARLAQDEALTAAAGQLSEAAAAFHRDESSPGAAQAAIGALDRAGEQLAQALHAAADRSEATAQHQRPNRHRTHPERRRRR